MLRLPVAAFAAALTVAGVVRSQAHDLTYAEEIVAAKSRAIVHVFVRIEKEMGPDGKDWFKDENDKVTGAVIDPSGLVLTHWKVCAEAFLDDGSPKPGNSIRIQLIGGDMLPAEIVAEDRGADLALLKFDPPAGADLQWFELADSDALVPGEKVVAAGYPDGENLYVFAGVASRASGAVELGDRRLEPDELVLTDASIRPTNDGGPLIDRDGRLLGLCNAKHFAEPKQDPTIEDLLAPSFGVAVAANTVRKSFAGALAKLDLKNPSLRAGAAVAKSPVRGCADILARKFHDAFVCVHIGDAPPKLGSLDPYARQWVAEVGSGVVIDDSGLILTTADIVGEDPESVHITTLSGKTYPVEVLRTDRGANAAILRCRATPGKWRFVELGTAKSVVRGEPVLAVGNPRGSALCVTTGVVSAKDRQRRIGPIPLGPDDLLQIDAPVHRGNTGGAVLDANGRMIALVDAGPPPRLVKGEQKEETNIGFVVPIDRLRDTFRSELDSHSGSNATTVTPAAESGEQRAARRNPITELAKALASSTVNVYVAEKVEKPDSFDPFADDDAKFVTRGLGSGMIIDASGLALTNWHVIDGADNVRVRTGTGEEYAAEVLSSSRIDDLALLQLELEEGQKVKPVEMGDSDALRPGAALVAIGNPLGHANTVTAGVLSATDQAINIKGRARKFRGLIQTDAAINPGNSGGALLDLQGRLVGINSAGSNADAEVGYAIPVNYALDRFYSRLLSAEKLNRAYLGLVVIDGDDGAPTVSSVDRFGPAADAKFQVGDVVRAVAGNAVATSVDFVRLSLEAVAGEPISIDIERGGKPMTLAPSPISNLVWTLFRQTNLEVEEVEFAESEDVRDAQVAMYRHYSGDATGSPSRIQPTAVRVVQVHPSAKGNGLDIEPGDFLMGLELRSRTVGGAQTQQLVSFASVDKLAEVCRQYQTKDGLEMPFFVYRGSEIRSVDVTIRKPK